MKLEGLSDVYLDQLRDMHSCEQQLIKAIPAMVKAAHDSKLKAAFTKHLGHTKAQLARLDTILTSLDTDAGRKVCKATAGLVQEASEIVDATGSDLARDAGLICAAQKVEHYEIASYGCLLAYAAQLGRSADVTLLEETLVEEKTANETLSLVALNSVNAKAMAEAPTRQRPSPSKPAANQNARSRGQPSERTTNA